jgi:hypothetical protein
MISELRDLEFKTWLTHYKIKILQTTFGLCLGLRKPYVKRNVIDLLVALARVCNSTKTQIIIHELIHGGAKVRLIHGGNL